ncbi:hypothetical protein N431DRAFT_465133 [Stipitochalara longipes BDJ]|nr:hypothetical protein N431DRAFT_465133 [Stipitochalara longipes BDJ]
MGMFACFWSFPHVFDRARAPIDVDTTIRTKENVQERNHMGFFRTYIAIRESHFRLGCWVVMLYSGFATIVTGTSAGKYGGGWIVASLVSYTLWSVTTSALVAFDLWRAQARTKAVLSHLGCCAISLYFFSSLLHIASADLPPFIPNTINLGLIGSLVFQQMSPNFEGQMFGLVANVFGLAYSPRPSHARRDGTPDLELGDGNNASIRSIAQDASSTSA